MHCLQVHDLNDPNLYILSLFRKYLDGNYNESIVWSKAGVGEHFMMASFERSDPGRASSSQIAKK